MQDGSLCSKADFLQLSSLCNLQDLQVELGVSHQTEHSVCFELASHLTALTALKLHVCTAGGFSSIGNCTNLQALVLPDMRGVVALELRAADWEVVGKLTRLTHLELWPVVQRTDCVACQSALQQLTELREVNADAWAPQVLLGLQGLSHLTTIGGGWLPGVGSAEPVTCPQIQELTYSYGDIPCSAFPKLLRVTVYKSVTSRALAALGKHCCLLETFRATDSPALRYTLDPDDSSAERVAALMSLVNLHHLTALSFSARDNPEVLALFSVAAVLARDQLKVLDVVGHSHSEVTSSGLVTLAQVSGLPVLQLSLLKPTLMRTSDVSHVFVSVLRGVGRVQLVVATEEQQTKLRNAFERIRSCGLPLPHKHVVSLKGNS